jgi:hypothetical protein
MLTALGSARTNGLSLELFGPASHITFLLARFGPPSMRRPLSRTETITGLSRFPFGVILQSEAP